jgi:pheromone shutdown protein TraB
MDVPINIWAVLLAAGSAMVIGSIWYAPKVLGDRWAKLVNLDDKKMKQGMAKSLGFALLCALLVAYIIAHVSFLSNQYFQNSFLQDSLSTAFWLWLGISATTLVVHDLYEQKPLAVTVINVGYQFTMIMTMGLIIGLIEPAALAPA